MYPSWTTEAKTEAKRKWRAAKRADDPEWKESDHLSKEQRAEYNRRYREKRLLEDPEWQTRYNKARPKRVPDYRRDEHLKRTYNMSIEDFDRLYEEQGGICAVCSESIPRTHKVYVDHDHACCPKGKSCGSCIRGLLCLRCNTTLGKLADDADLIRAMLGYVLQHRK